MLIQRRFTFTKTARWLGRLQESLLRTRHTFLRFQLMTGKQLRWISANAHLARLFQLVIPVSAQRILPTQRLPMVRRRLTLFCTPVMGRHLGQLQDLVSAQVLTLYGLKTDQARLIGITCLILYAAAARLYIQMSPMLRPVTMLADIWIRLIQTGFLSSQVLPTSTM